MATTTTETCWSKCIHQDTVQKVQRLLPEPKTLDQLADFFKLFADSTRIAIFWALSESELCVCDLCALLKMKQPAVSHQLKHLKQAGVVKTRRDGKVVYYALDDGHIRELLNSGMEHFNE